MLPAHHAIPACRAAQISARLGRSEGAAGTIYYAIVFTNRGPATCSLLGYPGVSSVGGASGTQIGAAARRSPGRLVTVVLRPGHSASAAYGQTQALNYPAARCHPLAARGLRVYAPNQTRARYLPLKHLACSTTTAGDSSVSPVRPGTTGQA